SMPRTLVASAVGTVNGASAKLTKGSSPLATGSAPGGAYPVSVSSSSSSVNCQIRESMGERGRESRANSNPVLAILTLEVTSDLVKLRKPFTCIEGYEQLDLGEGLSDRARDSRAQLLQALARLRRDQDRVRMAEPEIAAPLAVEQVDLVHHQ